MRVLLLVCLSVLLSAGTAFAGMPAPAALTGGEAPHLGVWGPVAVPSMVPPSRGVVAPAAAAVVRSALRYLGRPYQWSGIGHNGFDCSGLVYRAFGAAGIPVPHSSSAQYRAGASVPAARLGPGDLVFFHTYDSGPSHVGIYLGARRFIHASAARGVIVSSMDEPYYRSRYLGARRL